jgi:hypothetical protein
MGLEAAVLPSSSVLLTRRSIGQHHQRIPNVLKIEENRHALALPQHLLVGQDACRGSAGSQVMVSGASLCSRQSTMYSMMCSRQLAEERQM